MMFKVELGSLQALIETSSTIKISCPRGMIQSYYGSGKQWKV